MISCQRGSCNITDGKTEMLWDRQPRRQSPPKAHQNFSHKISYFLPIFISINFNEVLSTYEWNFFYAWSPIYSLDVPKLETLEQLLDGVIIKSDSLSHSQLLALARRLEQRIKGSAGSIQYSAPNSNPRFNGTPAFSAWKATSRGQHFACITWEKTSSKEILWYPLNRYLFRVLITYLLSSVHDILSSLEMKIGKKYEIACEKFWCALGGLCLRQPPPFHSQIPHNPYPSVDGLQSPSWC